MNVSVDQFAHLMSLHMVVFISLLTVSCGLHTRCRVDCVSK